MADQPLISAIVIFFNEERFLGEAIASVFQQTYDNWELLLVDDGSTDGSTAIAQECAARHPDKVFYLEHLGRENRGMSASRHLGVASARGLYIAYLDGDDVWLPHKLTQQFGCLQEHPQADMVHGPLRQWYSWTGNPGDRGRDRLYGSGHPYCNSLVAPPQLLALFLQRDEFIPSGFLVKRSVLEDGTVYEAAFREGYSDAIALVKICLKATVYVCEDCTYLYRKHLHSSTYRSWQNVADREPLAYFEWIAAYFERQNVSDPDLLRILERKLWHCRHPRLSRGLSLKHHLDSLEQLAIRGGRRVLPDAARHWLWLQWENLRIRVFGFH
ncbi:glycosyltransferase family 2 protein [Altericista sp. CCNU0014]|uniref:glycosyltransferase family 2 protein n=1 Tax=Altericista sp. CCNU0014 TaxID=3082949 RepID=UPI00384ECBBA